MFFLFLKKNILLFLLILPSLFIIPLFSIEFDSNQYTIKKLALNASIFIFLISITIWIFFNSFYTGYFQFFNKYFFYEILPSNLQTFSNIYSQKLNLNLVFDVGIDGISLFFLILTTFLIPLCILALWEYDFSNNFEEKLFFMLLFLLETALIGTFISLDLFFFYIFFELTLIPLYFLIGIF